MIIYLDENMPPHLARGFQIIQFPEGFKTNLNIEVKFLPDTFGRGSKDTEWIPKIGKEGSCVITQDIKISKRKNELDLFKKNKVGIFFLKGPSKKNGLSIWEMTQALAKNWDEICKIATTRKKPFGYEFSLNRKMKWII